MLEQERVAVQNLHQQTRDMQAKQGDLTADLEDLTAANSALSKQKRINEEELADLKNNLDKEAAAKELELAKGKALQQEYENLYAKQSTGSAQASDLAKIKNH